MSRMTVGVVEDHGQVLDSIVTLLRAAGFNVATFNSAEAFLDQCDECGWYEIGCLVLDVRLPGMSGIELTEELTRRDVDIPVVLISGHATREIAQLGVQKGASALLEKPFDGHLLVEKIVDLTSSGR